MLSPEQQKIFASLTCNTRVRVRFAEVTDPVWIAEPTDEDAIPTFGDAMGDGIYSGTMAVIVRGTPDEWRVDWVGNDYVVLDSEEREAENGEQETIRVTPAHLRDLEVLEAGDRWNRRETTIPGLNYAFVQREDGILEVGCQKIPREGQEQIVRLLAERLDLEVVPAGTIAAARTACEWIDSNYAGNETSDDLRALQAKLPKDS